ncbi:MAG: leucine-rich repeat protein, partial [Thermoguttaceae bacterium]|nr:leucine-rich repeat protein [Thermoguttaceae bacterium]
TLGAEAFTECSSLESLTLPKSLVQIGYDAFSDSPIKLVVYKDSYAEKWAKENGVNYEIVE